MIPKTAFFYWGNEDMSFLRYQTLKSFIKYNPTWKVVVYLRRDRPAFNNNFKEEMDYSYTISNDHFKDLEQLPFEKRLLEESNLPQKFYDKLSTLTEAQTKDILSYWLLATEGGFVFDTDIMFCAPMPEISEDKTLALVCFNGNPKKDYIPVTIMGGLNRLFYFGLFEKAINKEPNTYEAYGTDLINECFQWEGLTTFEAISRFFPTELIQLNSKIVFPYAETEVPWLMYHTITFEGIADLPPECVGIPWYAGHKLCQDWNQKLTKLNFKNYDSTICRLIREVEHE